MAEPHSIDLLSDEAFGWYLTGLTDGEGCFALTRSLVKGKRFPKWCTKFNITMRADETKNLRALARRMGCGTLYEHRQPGVPGNPVTCWSVFRREVLAQVVIPHFERFPLQCKKARDFEIWKSCVLLLCEVNNREQSRKPGATRLRQEEHDFLVNSVAMLKIVRSYDSSQSLKALTPQPPEGLSG